jgi:hypothetical protein
VIIAIVLCAIAAGAIVYFWYLPSREGGGEESDLEARNLVRQAVLALEQTYPDTGTFDPSIMTPQLLSAADTTITFNRMAGDAAATSPTAMTANNAVNYSGTATTYAVGTLSESGTAYGLVVDKGANSTTYYTDGNVVSDWNVGTGPTTTTQATTAPGRTDILASALDLAAQALVRNGMNAMENAYPEFGSFDPLVMTPDILAGIKPSVRFVAGPDTTVATAPISMALNDAVEYFGTSTSYAIGTVSESGNTFGVMVSLQAGPGDTTTYYVNGGVQDWEAFSSPIGHITPSSVVVVPTTPPIVGRYQDPIFGCSFEYPASWIDHPPEMLNQAVSDFESAYAVIDPLGPRIGSTPANYILFGGQREPGGVSSLPSVKLETLASFLAQDALAGAVVIEPTTDFEVNGVSAAAKTYRVQSSGEQTLWRLVSLVSGERLFYFFFVAQEVQWDENKVIFDAALDSFQAWLVALRASSTPAAGQA